MLVSADMMKDAVVRLLREWQGRGSIVNMKWETARFVVSPGGTERVSLVCEEDRVGGNLLGAPEEEAFDLAELFAWLLGYYRLAWLSSGELGPSRPFPVLDPVELYGAMQRCAMWWQGPVMDYASGIAFVSRVESVELRPGPWFDDFVVCRAAAKVLESSVR